MANEKVVKVGCGCLPLFGGISVTSALGVAFIILKLMGKLDWSWWWVTCPFWAGYALFFGMIATFFGGIAALAGVLGFADWWSRRRR